MTKHVHFALDNAAYSPPSTPSPTTSLSSLPSLPAPSTPPLLAPAVVYPHTPYSPKECPLPNDAPPPEEMHIHFLLAYSPYGEPAVGYNVSMSPLHLLEHQVTLESFADPATEPPLPALSILLPNLPWLLIVTPSSPKLGYVTVSDVFHSISSHLRLCAHPLEYRALEDGEAREVDMAYFNRCRNAGHDEQRQLEKGIRKIDFLMGRTQFLGLSATLYGEDVWELNVA